VKKRELVKRLREIAGSAGVMLLLVRQGGNHEIWSIGGELLVIPRHREINERTARSIIERAQEVTHGS
jgi:mRNA interferase HicA